MAGPVPPVNGYVHLSLEVAWIIGYQKGKEPVMNDFLSYEPTGQSQARWVF